MNLENSFDLFEFEHGVADCGVPVYVKNLSWIKGWCEIRVIIRVGARHDPVGKEGLAHLFEHLPGDGTEKFPSLEAVRNLNKRVFHRTRNANTGFDRTCFVGKVKSGNYQEAMNGFRELIFRPLLTHADVEREKTGVIKEEIREKIPNPIIANVLRKSISDLYGDHPLGRTAIAFGWEETVATITREELVNFHRQHYHLGNVELVFVGDITLNKALALTNIFGQGAPQSTPLAQPVIPELWSVPGCCRREYSFRQLSGSDQNFLQQVTLLARRVLSKEANPMLLSIINNTLREILFREIRGELGATYGIGINWVGYCDHNLFRLAGRVNPAHFETVTSIIERTLTDFPNSGECRREFEEQRMIEIDSLDTFDSKIESLADQAVNDLVGYGRIIPFKEDRQSCEAATYEKARGLVKSELRPDRLHWEILHP